MKAAIKALTIITVVALLVPALAQATNFRPRNFAMKRYAIGKSFHGAGRATFARAKFSPQRYRPGFQLARSFNSKFRSVGHKASMFGRRQAQRDYAWNSGRQAQKFNPSKSKFGYNRYHERNLRAHYTPSTVARAVNLW